MCASLLPQAMAVKTPAITAKAHPAVITIQPLASPLERLSSTPATTPSPRRINIIVPRNSPRIGEVIDLVPFLRIGPIERTLDGFFPVLVKASAPVFVKGRLPDAIDGPFGAQLVEPGEKAHGQTGGVGRAQGGGFLNHGPHDFAVQNGRLGLTQ